MNELHPNPPNPTATDSAPVSSGDALQNAADAFVRQLNGMRDNDKGRLAALRRNVGEVLPGRGTAWFPQMLYSIKDDKAMRAALRHSEIFFLVATLYDLNRRSPLTGNRKDMGHALSEAAAKSGANGVGRRFHVLLDASFDFITDSDNPDARVQRGGGEMAFRLRQTVKLCAAKEVGIHWAQLLVDLCRWDDASKSVQKKWARSFFHQSAEVPSAADSLSELPVVSQPVV